MNYETAEERATQEAERLTIPRAKFALGQSVYVKGGRLYRGAVHTRVYCADESLWLYTVLREDNMQIVGYIAEYALESKAE